MDLPVVLKWVVAAVKPVLQVETRAKIQVCQLPSPLFPFPDSILDFTTQLKRVSLPPTARAPEDQVSHHTLLSVLPNTCVLCITRIGYLLTLVCVDDVVLPSNAVRLVLRLCLPLVNAGTASPCI